MRRQQTGLTFVLEPITLSVDVENVAVVQYQHRRRYHRVSQQLSPVGEAFVLRQYDAATLVPRGHQAEERSCDLPVVRPDAELIHYQHHAVS